MRRKSSKRYSYEGHDSRESKFIHKSFNKTDSYNTNFSMAVFENTAFVGAKFKFCSFYGTVFDNCYLRGTLFRGGTLENAVFKNCIISATVFDRPKIKGIKFESCKVLSTTKISRFLLSSSFVDTEIFETYPSASDFSSELITVVEALRSNDFIRRSSVLHRKEKKLDTISLRVLVEKFGETFLIKNLEKLPELIVKEFYTLSYISHFLRKLQACDINEFPGPAALGTPKNNE